MDCVILAAGFSSRMGCNKMLLNVGGKTVIEGCMDAFYECCSKIIVVTGRYHEDIEYVLKPYKKVCLKYNKNYQNGMFSSVKAGIKHVESERFFLTPGDYPLIKSETIKHMLRKTSPIITPAYQGKQGHPILLNKIYIPIILNSSAVSLRECLYSYSSEKMVLPVDDIGILKDLDTVEVYEKLVQFKSFL